MMIQDLRKDKSKSLCSMVLDVIVTGRDGSSAEKRKEIICDKSVFMRVNGVFRCELSATPVELAEMTAGWLHSHELIRDIDDIKEIVIKDINGIDDISIDVYIKDNEATSSKENEAVSAKEIERISAKDNNKASAIKNEATSAKDNNTRSSKKDTKSKERIKVNHEWILELIDDRPIGGELRKRTEAAHSCMLIEIVDQLPSEYKMLHISEDTSRHTAMDKAIGHALINKVDLNRCILLVSGRISSSMVKKAAASGVIALISVKHQTTVEAVHAAKKKGIMLVGINRDGELIIYERAGLI